MSALHRLIADARYEVIPLKNLDAQLPHIPAGASVSVTCSFAKGQQTTLDLTRKTLGNFEGARQKPGKYSLMQKAYHLAVAVLILVMIGTGLVAIPA